MFAEFKHRIFFRKLLIFQTDFFANFEIAELCKGVHCIDLGESFPTHIYLQNLASIQPRTSPVKFARPSNAAASECSVWPDRGEPGPTVWPEVEEWWRRHRALAAECRVPVTAPLPRGGEDLRFYQFQVLTDSFYGFVNSLQILYELLEITFQDIFEIGVQTSWLEYLFNTP